MNSKEVKKQQAEMLKNLCMDNGVEYDDIQELLESIKVKKLLKRNNYHLQKLNDIIEKSSS